MTGDAGPEVTDPYDPGQPAPRRWSGLAGAAVLIGGVTVLARVVGFAKSLAFSHTVGQGCLSAAYFTANQVPTIVYDIVVGGALASMVVPVLAGPAERAAARDGRGAAEARRISGALLTWSVLILVPCALVIALAARPLAGALVGHPHGCAAGGRVADVAAGMLVVFAPQIVLYGLAVVLYGVLQAHRRFLGPALAPLISSLVVIAAYLSFVPLSGDWDGSLATLPRSAELALSIGTTLGVAALVVTVLGPVRRLGLHLRPALTFPPGVGARVRRLALAGLATLIAEDAAMVVVIKLANARGGGGALAVFNYAWALYQVPYAVLAVPIATSAFPALAGRAAAGDRRGYDAMAAATTRAVVLVSCAAAAVLAAVAVPVARVYLLGTRGGVPPAELARAIVAFAPGLIGYGLIAHVGKALYARGSGRGAAIGTVAGWTVVIAAQLALVAVVPRSWVVAALGLGCTIGMTAGGAALLAVLARRARTGGAPSVGGPAAAAGLPRALGAGVAGGLAGYAAGAAVAAAVPTSGVAASVGAAVGAAVAATLAFAVVAGLLDRRDLAAALARTPLRALPGIRGIRPTGGPPGDETTDHEDDDE